MTRWANIAITWADRTLVFKPQERGQVQVLERSKEPCPLTGHIYDRIVGSVSEDWLAHTILQEAAKNPPA